ncbi:hypothetical protein [Streptomyces sp. NPDC048425]|uniref:hypothetical protein n=1 Tax=Streptomyces sp. NPDC048425 TaxID=3365548 RepID=UPI00371FE803
MRERSTAATSSPGTFFVAQESRGGNSVRRFLFGLRSELVRDQEVNLNGEVAVAEPLAAFPQAGLVLSEAEAGLLHGPFDQRLSAQLIWVDADVAVGGPLHPQGRS